MIAQVWKALPSPPDQLRLARAGLSSTLVDDAVYIISGRDKKVHMADMLKFSILTQSWEILPDLPFTARAHHSATLVGREIWIIGGMAAEYMCNDVRVYNVDTCKWRKEVVRCPGHKDLLRRTAHACVQHPLQPHCLLIYGGLDDSESYLDDLLILDTATRVVKQVVPTKGPRPQPRAYHTLTALDNLVYLFSGRISLTRLSSDLEVYSPELNEWLSPAPVSGVPPSPRSSHRAVALKDRIVVFGGVLASTSRINNIDTLRIERKGRAAPCKAPLSVSLRWCREDQPADESVLPCVRGACAMEILDDTLFVFGGYAGDKRYPSDAWALPLGVGRAAGCTASRGGRGGSAARGRGAKRRMADLEPATNGNAEWRIKKRQVANSAPVYDLSPLPRTLPAACANAKARELQEEAAPRMQPLGLPTPPAAIQGERDERMAELEQQVLDHQRREREHSAQALEHRNALQHERDLVVELRRRVAVQEAELRQERDCCKKRVDSIQQQVHEWIARHDKLSAQLQAAEAASRAHIAEAAQLRQQAAEASSAAAQAAAVVREREGEVQRAQAERQQEREAAAGAMSRKQAELDAARRSVHQLREHLLVTQGDLQKEKQALEQERTAHQGTHAQVQQLQAALMKEQEAAIAARDAVREEQKAGKAALQQAQLHSEQLQAEKDDLEYRLGQSKANLDHAKEQGQKWQTQANAAEQKFADLENDHNWLKDRCLDYEKVTKLIAGRWQQR